MKHKRVNQQGFGVVEIILIILAIGLAVAGVWWIYENNRTKVGDAESGTTQSSDNPPIKTNPEPATSYLEIQEWNVKLPLSADISDVYYSTKGSGMGADGLPNTVWLSLRSLDDKGCNITDGPSLTAAPVGSILRVLPTDEDPVQGQLYTKLYPNGATIEGYYYVYTVWKNRSCGTEDYLKSIDYAFVTAAKGSKGVSN